jgi:hypothetical protein
VRRLGADTKYTFPPGCGILVKGSVKQINQRKLTMLKSAPYTLVFDPDPQQAFRQSRLALKTKPADQIRPASDVKVGDECWIKGLGDHYAVITNHLVTVKSVAADAVDVIYGVGGGSRTLTMEQFTTVFQLYQDSTSAITARLMPMSCQYVFAEESIVVFIPEELAPLLNVVEANSHRYVRSQRCCLS